MADCSSLEAIMDLFFFLVISVQNSTVKSCVIMICSYKIVN